MDMENLNEKELDQKVQELKNFLVQVEKDLADTLLKEVYNIKSQVSVTIASHKVAIHLGAGPRGIGDIILRLELNDGSVPQDRSKYRIVSIYVPGIDRDLNKAEHRDGIIVAARLVCQLGEFGRKCKRYVEEYNDKYSRYEKLLPKKIDNQDINLNKEENN